MTKIENTPPQTNAPCPCTLIEQDESCPIGYPSMICGVCRGIGSTTPEQVTALACEMIKISSDIGEPEDPFAAWESIDLIRTERAHFYKQFQVAWAALTPVSENEKRGMERVLAILRSKQSQAVDEGNGFGPTWSARNKAFNECAEMLRLALEAEATPQTTADSVTDSELLDALSAHYWDLRCVNVPIGGDDCDVDWIVVEHHMAEPRERTIAQAYCDDPRVAIRRAIRANDPDAETCVACGEVLHDGDTVYFEPEEEGHIHSHCAGGDPNSFVNEDGKPITGQDPLPEPFRYMAGSD